MVLLLGKRVRKLGKLLLYVYFGSFGRKEIRELLITTKSGSSNKKSWEAKHMLSM